MRTRILMVSAMILLLGSQGQTYAQHHVNQDRHHPGYETPKTPVPIPNKHITTKELIEVQQYYLKHFHIRLSRKEAESILLEYKKGHGPHDFSRNPPPPPKGYKPHHKPGHKPQPKPEPRPQQNNRPSQGNRPPQEPPRR